MANSHKSTAIGDDILQRVLHSDMVTLRVGPKKKIFRIHKNLITAKSEYFNKAFTGHGWEESYAKTIDLDDASAIVVNVMVAWLYSGRVHYVPEHVSAQEAADPTATLEMSPSGRPLDVPKADNPDLWDIELLVDVYIFADRYMLQALKQDLLPHVSARLQLDDSWLPYDKDSMKLIHYVWTNLPHDSGLKKLIIDIWAFDHEWEMSDELAELLPAELWIALIKNVWARLPNRLCQSCVYRACGDRENRHWQFGRCFDGTVKFDTEAASPFYGKELTPFDFDMCIYHEHQDNAELEACKAEAAAKAQAKAKADAEAVERVREDEMAKQAVMSKRWY